MPVKRRAAKRRVHHAAELAAWSGVFECEYDFFGDLEDFGISGDKAVREAAPEAWQRLGAEFMAGWKPTQVRETPWALEEFGEPGKCQ